MGRRKGSLNKKIQPIQLDFDDIKKFDEQTEVCMTTNTIDEAIKTIDESISTLSQSEGELEQIQQEIDLARMELEKTKLEIETKKHELKVIGDAPIAVKPAESPSITIKNTGLSEKIAERKVRDCVMVTGKFHNLRAKGQSIKLPYLKYGDEAVKWWPFDHGKVYTIPKGFADQINGGDESDPCYYTPHFIKNEGVILNPDDPESGIHAVDTTDKKYSFTPINF